MNDKSGLIIGIGTLADYLNVSRPTVRNYIKSGLPGTYVKFGDNKRGTWHFHISNVEKYFAEQTAKKAALTDDEIFEEDETIIQKKNPKNSRKKILSRKKNVK